MHKIGSRFEARAESALHQAGLGTVLRNYRSRFGEIDLIMEDGTTLVFVEVRYRKHPTQGGAAASVGPRKRQRLLRTAALFLAEHSHHAQRPCRFDVVSFDGPEDEARFHWHRAAFETSR